MILVKRFIAYAIDITILSIITYPYFLYYGIEGDGGDTYTLRGVYYLPPIIVWYLYFVFLETVWKTTVGKRIFSLYIRKTDGTNVKFIDIIKRRIFDFPELFFMPLIAFFVAISTSKNQRVGDLIAKTTVVYYNKKAQ
jgi:uncharacterized RDD family membrane protein YckC